MIAVEPTNGRLYLFWLTIVSKAARNRAISAAVPTVTRTRCGQIGQLRPMTTPCSAIAVENAAPSRCTSTTKQFASDGTQLKPRLPSQPMVSCRTRAFSALRCAINPGSRRLASPAAIAVTGSGLSPRLASSFSRSGCAAATPRRRPAMP